MICLAIELKQILIYQMCMRPGVGVTPTTIYAYHKHRYMPYLYGRRGGGGHSNAILACMFLKNEIFLVRGEESRGPRFDVIFVENLI